MDKICYHPGHRWYHETSHPVSDTVRYLAEVALAHDYAIPIGVGCGSMDPAYQDRVHDDPIGATVQPYSGHPNTALPLLTYWPASGCRP